MSEYIFSRVTKSSDVELVIKLISKVYADSGYVSEDGNKDETSISDFLRNTNSTCTFRAIYQEQLVGTISIVSDQERGLPMDTIYKTEVDLLRTAGERVAEVCQFAIDKTVLKSLPITKRKIFEADLAMQLLGLSINYGFLKDFDYYVFSINPKHRVFYEMLGCQKIGEEKQYGSVNNAPALAYKLSLRDLKQQQESGKGKNMILRRLTQFKVPEGVLD